MDFDSPDVMKDFPGLYSSELNKKCNNDSDYSDETEKSLKKDMLIGKRKDKKDKKDKERGYAALEGESSADENSKLSRSPSKSKKTKSFKFTTKSKEKREKSREKDKDVSDKKKERDKKSDKKIEKDKGKKIKQSVTKQSTEDVDIAEILPIFGVNLETCVERSRCHDGIDLPLPIRECIDYIEAVGILFEGVYKISGTKSKVLQIKKMYNNRQFVNLNDYDVPTATSLLKMFLRDLPEPIFTNEYLIRFEEAGAILNLNTREKHLRILVDMLPPLNKLLLSWLIIHLDNITLNEKINKMTKQNLSAALNHTFHSSSRLLHALLHHSRGLFPNIVIKKYIPPLTAGSQLPDNLNEMETELRKQESLLSHIHKEMNVGCISKQREELLWEVQRIITQLKRKIKLVHRDKEASTEKINEKPISEIVINQEIPPTSTSITQVLHEEIKEEVTDPIPEFKQDLAAEKDEEILKDTSKNYHANDINIMLLQFKNSGLQKLRDNLIKQIQLEKNDITALSSKIKGSEQYPSNINSAELNEIIIFLQKENQRLQMKKTNFVRKIIEHQECCVELKAKLDLLSVT